MQTGTARTLLGWRVLALATWGASFLLIIPTTDGLAGDKPRGMAGGGSKGSFAPKPIRSPLPIPSFTHLPKTGAMSIRADVGEG